MAGAVTRNICVECDLETKRSEWEPPPKNDQAKVVWHKKVSVNRPDAVSVGQQQRNDVMNVIFQMTETSGKRSRRNTKGSGRSWKEAGR